MNQFFMGAATAAHQVEGNNTHSDCWAMENMRHSTFNEPSGMCCDHYNRYVEDIRLMAEAGLNAYRFSMVNGIIHPSMAGYREWRTPVIEEYLYEYLR